MVPTALDPLPRAGNVARVRCNQEAAMKRLSLLATAFVLGSVGPASADDPPLAPLTFDEVNTPLERVIARATAATKPIFIDFFLEG